MADAALAIFSRVCSSPLLLRPADRPHGLVGPVADDRPVGVRSAGSGEAQGDQLQAHDDRDLREDRMIDRRLVDARYRESLGTGGLAQGRKKPVAITGRAY